MSRNRRVLAAGGPLESSTAFASLGVTGPFTHVRFDYVLQDALCEDEMMAASRYDTAALRSRGSAW